MTRSQGLDGVLTGRGRSSDWHICLSCHTWIKIVADTSLMILKFTWYTTIYIIKGGGMGRGRVFKLRSQEKSGGQVVVFIGCYMYWRLKSRIANCDWDNEKYGRRWQWGHQGSVWGLSPQINASQGRLLTKKDNDIKNRFFLSWLCR